MKNLIFLLLIVLGAGFFTGCEKEKQDPRLDAGQTVRPAITSPADNASFVLVQEDAGNLMTNFEWSPTQYNLNNLERTKYLLQVDLEGNNFADPHDMVSTEGTSFGMTVGEMNNLMIVVLELNEGESQGLELRVRSFVNEITKYSEVFSDVVKIFVTPYGGQIAIKPIYLLGSATTVGWSADNALPMAHIGGGKFARVETLTTGADQYLKFISIPGLWAPQWGTDENGTSESGTLVYRPDEQTTDPPGIPFLTGESGNYYIMADTANLEYETYLTTGELYLVGDASPAGWDNTAAIAFTESSPHVFTLVTTLNATGGMKFLEKVGAWAPQWGTDASGTGSKGLLSYRPSESVPDPPQVPAPSTAGSYKITVDMTTMEYKIEAQ